MGCPHSKPATSGSIPNSASSGAIAAQPNGKASGVLSTPAPAIPTDSAVEVKLLLLGPGESGKSTILKQMKEIFQSGYSQEERLEFKRIVHGNTILSIQVLLRAAQKLSYALEDESNVARAIAVAEVNPTGFQFSPEIGDHIKHLWEDGGIQKTYARNNEYQLNDSAPYYFENIDRISAPNYIPTLQDILRTRVQTSGITEIEFQYGGIHFRMVDVGGQRNERKKWIHCFHGVTSVIFVVSLSEYDQKLREDSLTNRMKESLLLFDEICNSKWFADTSVILFLNKTDLFKEKLARGIPLKACFPDYEGGQDFEAAATYMQSQFLALNRKPEVKKVYPHMTCATDTGNIRVVFAAVKDIIIKRSIRQPDFT